MFEKPVQPADGSILSVARHNQRMLRKHTRRLRYQRQFARRSRGSECVLSRNLPRHRKAKPAAQLRAPMGEDSATLHWQANLRTMLDMQHPKNIRVRYSIGGTPTFYRE